MSQHTELRLSGILVRASLFLALAITIIQFFNILYGRVNIIPKTPRKTVVTSSVTPASDSEERHRFKQPEIELKQPLPVYHEKSLVDKKLREVESGAPADAE